VEGVVDSSTESEEPKEPKDMDEGDFDTGGSIEL
jgi:hypothetical protein